ncbi:hypothetical protein P9D51_24020 [Bacillus sonorensis]|uniref:hypothetical protein n=1 Tax=Bacillus sonorensis TaxID=119858 RepID=UPI002DB6BCFC|nr:hypothetical protein [Bacillus sonorensis]MEC1429113.1 hypothetical protein [Bacillus sonorensis]
MGMYTGLRCKVIIKPEFREEFQFLSERQFEWSDSNIDFLKEFGDYSRSTFIPNGALSYMPDNWSQEDELGNEIPTDGFDRRFEKDTGLWTFQCSLKDYDDTIAEFLNKVLIKVVEEVVHLEEFYEEWETGRHYVLSKDGRFDSYRVKER